MRWLVEVSSIGKGAPQKFCVEAESWQKALQATRAERGESGPMSGFSIELLEEGYRAVDPVARVRFVVKRAPDDAPLGRDVKSLPPAAAAPAPKTEPRTSAPPRPSVPVPTSSPSKATSISYGTNGGGGAPADAAKPSGAPAPATQPTPAPIGTSLPGMVPVVVLTSREQEPTDASPLYYREYAFAVPAGTSEEACVEVLRAQLRLVEAHLASAKQGKLANLAVFDVEFKGKPPRPPIATLTWKDWKPEPEIGYPARNPGKGAPRPPTGPTESFPPPVVAPASPAAQPSPAAVARAPVAAAAPSPDPAVAPVAPPPAVAVAPPAPPAPHTQPLPVEPHVRARVPSTPRFRGGRQSGDELITTLFEAMHDLHFLRDALEGGQFCLALAADVLPSVCGFVHFFDIDKREWVVACARGKDTQRLLTMRSPESDEVLRSAARERRAVVPNAATDAVAPRYQQIGGAQSLIVAPIMQAGRALGAIEIINPTDGAPFTENERNAMTYIAEQYAEYLGSRGIVLDRERIQSAARLVEAAPTR